MKKLDAQSKDKDGYGLHALQTTNDELGLARAGDNRKSLSGQQKPQL